eukprot:4937025-Pyramimonas_sp.AAC.1
MAGGGRIALRASSTWATPPSSGSSCPTAHPSPRRWSGTSTWSRTSASTRRRSGRHSRSASARRTAFSGLFSARLACWRSHGLGASVPVAFGTWNA